MMTNQPKPTMEKNETGIKKIWKSPIIEIIGQDAVQTGSVTGTEGKHFTLSTTRHYIGGSTS
jgi:hypothetical protein